MASTTLNTNNNASTATHLQLLLQQHHALQRQEHEAKERLEREKQQLKNNSTQSSSSTTSASASALNLKADAHSVAAYMAAYLKAASTTMDRARMAVDSAATPVDEAPATIAPSSTLLYPSPPPTSSSSAAALSAPSTSSQQKTSKLGKSHIKKPSISSSDSSTRAGISSADSVPKSQHRQECHNCGVTKTPLWRRTHDRLHSLCNACGLYYKQYKANRPLAVRPTKDSLITGAESLQQQQQQQLQQHLHADMQAKRRKMGDNAAATGAGSVKHESKDESPTPSPTPLKLLLPHPPAYQQRPRSSPVQVPSPSSSPSHTVEAESEDDAGNGSEGGEERAENEAMGMDTEETGFGHQASEDDSDDSEDEDEEYVERQPRNSGSRSNMRAVTPNEDTPEPQQRSGNANTNSSPIIECANCGQTQTPLWRKDAKGQSICNACGLYARLHQRDRPVTMRKAKIARRKRDWSAAQEKMTANGGQAEQGRSKKRKEKTAGTASVSVPTSASAGENHTEVRAMNIPVTSEHEADESSLCLMEQGAEDHHEIPTPVSNASLSPMMSGSMPTMTLGNGALSPSLTASPPTPVLASPHFLNAASSFPGLNPHFFQQYQQQLQNHAAFSAVTGLNPPISTATTEGLPLIGDNWLSQLYSQYPSAPLLHAAALSRDPMALAGLQQRQQKMSTPLSPVSLTNVQSFSPLKPNPVVTSAPAQRSLQQQQQQQQKQQRQSQQHQSQHDQRQNNCSKKPQGPLILDSTRFTRLMNQMSKPQLSMFLTILEERCGALRHRLSGEDDEVERVDTNEMMMMLNNPQFTSMEGALNSSSSTTVSSNSASANILAMSDMEQDYGRPNHLKTMENNAADFMM
ncbi:putative electron transfer flavoprotein subunit [Mortierella polycephala]|uniref:Electron transfer flavoprotein subunit n=1 Tax=Mortierella polycephala TaxID=41804 RepID=A0A9P6QDZ8_9FUNG|nr:putative electron transfer flavoprotein subunit [Mortierella polycephala]